MTRGGPDRRAPSLLTPYSSPDQTPANSLPHRSQYHSVARFIVPHSGHLRVRFSPVPRGFGSAPSALGSAASMAVDVIASAFGFRSRSGFTDLGGTAASSAS